MRFWNICLTGICLACIIGGCRYSPSETFYNNINPPGNHVASISLDTLTDAYHLIVPTTFAYAIGSTITPTGITVNVGSQVLFSSSYRSGVFMLDPEDFVNGSHQITLISIFPTNTGSLAEMMGAEQYKVEKTFTIIVDKVPPVIGIQPTASLQDGILKLEWNAPGKTNFHYWIKRKNLSSFGEIVYKIYDPTVTTFTDISYLGEGNIEYTIDMVSSSFTVAGIPVMFNEKLVDATFSQTGNIITATWTVNVLGPNTNFWLHGDRSISPPQTNGSINVDTLILGDLAAWVFNISRLNTPYKSVAHAQFESTGRMDESFFGLTPLPGNKIIVAKSNIRRINLNDMTVEQQVSGPPFYLANSTMLASQNGNDFYIGFGPNGLIRYNANSLGSSTGYSPNFIMSSTAHPYNSSGFTLTSVSNNRFISITNFSGNLNTILIDLNTQTVPLFIPNAKDPMLSSDGVYLFVNQWNSSLSAYEGTIYSKASGTWTLASKTIEGRAFFRASNPLDLTVATATQVQRYNTAGPVDGSGHLTPSATTSLSGVVSYDWVTDRLVTQTITQPSSCLCHYSTLRTYDWATLSLDQTMKARLVTTLGPPYAHVYTSNYHFVSSLLGAYGEQVP